MLVLPLMLRPLTTHMSTILPPPEPSSRAPTKLLDVLDDVPDVDVAELQDSRPYYRRWDTLLDNPAFDGPHADYVLPACHSAIVLCLSTLL